MDKISTIPISALKIKDLIKKAIWLSWFTISYNLIEGFVSIFYGMCDNSMALAGFGVDSLIEVASAFFVLWRLKGEQKGLEILVNIYRERKATLGIGILFIILSLTTIIASLIQLSEGSHPKTTMPGVIISSLSLSFMFFLWKAKEKVAMAIESSTLMKDADCSLACIKLSIILLIGSFLFLLIPTLWWSDAFAALLLSVLVAKEGYETIQNARKPDFSGGCGCVD